MRSIHFSYRGIRHQAEVTELNSTLRVAFKIKINRGKTFVMAESKGGVWDCNDPKIPQEMLKGIGKVLGEV
jgi:hypothetical protein